MKNPDAHVKLGEVHDYEGRVRVVRRDYEALDLSEVRALLPAGVRELEEMLAKYWQELFLFRLRELGITNVEVNYTKVGRQLAFLLGGPVTDLADVDWPEVGRQLKLLKNMAGMADLRLLYDRLAGNEMPRMSA